MNRLTKFLIGGALAVMSVLGIVALNLSPDVALAQTPTATPAPGQPGGPGGRGASPGRGFGHLGGAEVDTAIAQALGITAEQLRTELQAGKTLAQLAQEKGVSQDAVKQAIGNAKKAAVDAAVAAGRLTAEQATQMKARIDTEIAALDLSQSRLGGPKPGMGGPKPGMGGPGMGKGGPGHIGGPEVDTAIAQALGITAEQLRTELQAGKTLAQLAQEKGVSQDAVKQAIGNAKKAAVDAAVAAGRLTAEQATQMKARIDTEIAALDLSQSRVGGLKPDKGLGRGFRGAPGQINPNATPNSTVPNFRGRPAPVAPSGSSL